MIDIYAYGSVDDYMSRYKGYIADTDRHAAIDAFYLCDGKLLFSLLNVSDSDIPRPHYDDDIILHPHKNISNQDLKVQYDMTFYLPKSNSIGFIKYGILFKKYRLSKHCSRFLGTKPTEVTHICWNWYYDSKLKRINFVV